MQRIALRALALPITTPRVRIGMALSMAYGKKCGRRGGTPSKQALLAILLNRWVGGRLQTIYRRRRFLSLPPSGRRYISKSLSMETT